MQATATCLITLVLAAGATCANAAAVPRGAASNSADTASVLLDSGEASWYGPRHEGRRTSSGEVFDSHKLTAAHASLPLGSYVRVVVEDTGRSIVVKVNDREPPHGVRCIDLSRAAAARLGIVNRGIANVTLQAVSSQDAEVELAEAPDDAAPTRLLHAHGHAHRGRARAKAHHHHH
jgi:rare lipoprotein A